MFRPNWSADSNRSTVCTYAAVHWAILTNNNTFYDSTMRLTLLRPGCLRRSRPEILPVDGPSPLPHRPMRSRSISECVHLLPQTDCDWLPAQWSVALLFCNEGGAGLIADSLLGKRGNFSVAVAMAAHIRTASCGFKRTITDGAGSMAARPENAVLWCR